MGYIGWNGNMDTAIAIRTAVIKDKMLYIQAGAGIVADSVPRSEWNETMNKARAIFRAVEMASKAYKIVCRRGAEDAEKDGDQIMDGNDVSERLSVRGRGA